MSTKSAGSESKSTSTSYTPEQKKWLGQALALYGPQLGKGEQVYGGERVAPFTGTQQAALSDMGGYLDTFAPGREIPLYGEGGTALSQILSGQMGAKQITPEATQAYYKSVFEQPALKGWGERIKPEIQEAYAGPGYWGGARAGAVVEGRQDVEDWLGEQRGGLEWDVSQANRAIEEAKAGRALSAIGPSMAYGQLPTQEAQARLAGRAGVFEFAGAGQAQKQAEINANIQKFVEENRITSAEDMQILLALLGMSYSTSTSTGESWGPGLGYSVLSGMAGGFGQGVGAGAAAKYAP